MQHLVGHDQCLVWFLEMNNYDALITSIVNRDCNLQHLTGYFSLMKPLVNK